MINPVVSVVVLTKNSMMYIARCLKSLEHQTLQNFEVLIVDAGSTDNTRAIVNTFDDRFKWLDLPNSDMGAARNYGISNSKGEIVFFLDSDDFYLPTKLESQVKFLQCHPNVDVHFCAAWHFRTGNTVRLGLKKTNAQPASINDFIQGRNHNLGTMSLRRSILDTGFKFGEGDRGRYGEEWRLQLSMAVSGVQMVFQPEPLVVVEIRPDSHTAWSLQWVMKQQAIREIENVATLLTPAQRGAIDITRILDNFRWKLVIALLLDGRNMEALDAANTITDSVKARRARQLIAFSRYFHKTILQKTLRIMWIWRQNRSFTWQKTPSALRAYFKSLEANPISH
jgi:glycosyltransferase involved in cell wall biosynthesis